MSLFKKSGKRNNLIMLQKVKHQPSQEQLDKEYSLLLMNMEKDLNKMKNKVTCASINKVIDFYQVPIKPGCEEDQQLFVITEAQQGIPIFEWMLESASKTLFTENMAAHCMREIFGALKLA